MYGKGFYFADTPVKSHGYTAPDENNVRSMFMVNVLLGN